MLKVEISNEGQAVITLDGNFVKNVKDINVLKQVMSIVFAKVRKKMISQYIKQCGSENITVVSQILESSLNEMLKSMKQNAIIKLT